MTPDLMALYSNGTVTESLKTWLLVLAIRDAVRKAIALWKSAGKKQIVRFICLFIFNTIGILPIVYLVLSKFKKDKKIEDAAEKTIGKREKKGEKALGAAEGKIENSIENTIEKVEKIIKKSASPAKKAPAKKPVAKKTK